MASGEARVDGGKKREKTKAGNRESREEVTAENDKMLIVGVKRKRKRSSCVQVSTKLSTSLQ